MQNGKLEKGVYSVAGWWRYSDTETAVFVRDRGEAFADLNFRHDFFGTLFFDENGVIDQRHSIIQDKHHTYSVRSGEGDRKRGHLDFITRKQSHVDDILFVVRHDDKTRRWQGSFEGDMVGEGTVELVLGRLSE